MLDWIRRFFAGDAGPPPDGVTVERDASGRIARVSASLRASRDTDAQIAHPRVAFTAALAPVLSAASRWLCERNIVAAQQWAIGLEQRYDVDQAEGRLTLEFEVPPALVLEVQVLGSFDPSDRSFMWSWHNASVQPAMQVAALRARTEGERIGEPTFTTPVQTVSFDELTPLLAYAAQLAEADGVYRAVLPNHTSVFLTYQLPRGAAALPPMDPAFAKLVLDRVRQYDRDQFANDRAYHEGPPDDDGTHLERVMQAKLTIWQRDWVTHDDTWPPDSTGWPSAHDRRRAHQAFLAPHPQGGVLDVTIGDGSQQSVYCVESVGDEAKITDQLIDWGRGFVWPRWPL
jgi:hypothetical protein